MAARIRPIGSGQQYFSWIHRDDWIAMVLWALDSPNLAGVLNATTPLFGVIVAHLYTADERATPALAQAERGAVVDILIECAKIDDPTARLACYDNNMSRVGATPFLLPLMQRLVKGGSTGSTRVLILAPTRELAVQTFFTAVTPAFVTEELPDGLIVRGPTPLSGGEVESLDDHRIAMSFAVAGLVADANVKVRGWSCVDTSFPEFLDLLGEAQRAR